MDDAVLDDGGFRARTLEQRWEVFAVIQRLSLVRIIRTQPKSPGPHAVPN